MYQISGLSLKNCDREPSEQAYRHTYRGPKQGSVLVGGHYWFVKQCWFVNIKGLYRVQVSEKYRFLSAFQFFKLTRHVYLLLIFSRVPIIFPCSRHPNRQKTNMAAKSLVWSGQFFPMGDNSKFFFLGSWGSNGPLGALWFV